MFLVLTVVDAALVVVTPLLVKRIVDDGILKQDTPRWSCCSPWSSPPWRCVDAGLALGMGWLSSRIGEGLIYDLRTSVFAHVQRMSLAFFTRTQTGALVSRLNNDVIGAQRAFTSTLSSTVSNMISVVVVGIAMIALSLADHPAVPADVPDPAARVPLGRPTGWPASPASRCRATPTSATR